MGVFRQRGPLCIHPTTLTLHIEVERPAKRIVLIYEFPYRSETLWLNVFRLSRAEFCRDQSKPKGEINREWRDGKQNANCDIIGGILGSTVEIHSSIYQSPTVCCGFVCVIMAQTLSPNQYGSFHFVFYPQFDSLLLDIPM